MYPGRARGLCGGQGGYRPVGFGRRVTAGHPTEGPVVAGHRSGVGAGPTSDRATPRPDRRRSGPDTDPPDAPKGAAGATPFGVRLVP